MRLNAIRVFAFRLVYLFMLFFCTRTWRFFQGSTLTNGPRRLRDLTQFKLAVPWRLTFIGITIHDDNVDGHLCTLVYVSALCVDTVFRGVFEKKFVSNRTSDIAGKHEDTITLRIRFCKRDRCTTPVRRHDYLWFSEALLYEIFYRNGSSIVQAIFNVTLWISLKVACQCPQISILLVDFIFSVAAFLGLNFYSRFMRSPVSTIGFLVGYFSKELYITFLDSLYV